MFIGRTKSSVGYQKVSETDGINVKQFYAIMYGLIIQLQFTLSFLFCQPACTSFTPLCAYCLSTKGINNSATKGMNSARMTSHTVDDTATEHKLYLFVENFVLFFKSVFLVVCVCVCPFLK